LIDLLKAGGKGWCDQSAKMVLACQQELADSFYEALAAIEKFTSSDDMADWQWGKLHFVEYTPQPFGGVKLLDKLLMIKRGVGGATNTVNVSNSVASPSGGYRQTFGSVFRLVSDLGDEQAGGFMMSTGQSGHIFSPHYADMNDTFDSVTLRGFATDSSASSTLILLPLEASK
jgi:penicillin amidase